MTIGFAMSMNSKRIIRYIEENPVKAGLVEFADQWLFSSAYARKLTDTPWGLPLPKVASVLDACRGSGFRS